MKKIKPGFSVQTAILIAAMMLAANLVLGGFLAFSSRSAMKTLIQNRMLDMSTTAADMVDGNVYEKLQAEDADTPEYRKINDTLKKFQDNIDLKFIYGVRQSSPGEFTFTVDPHPTEASEFGGSVVSTKALVKAFTGVPTVDDEPYTDAWGTFYSAYSPIFNSKNEVVGVIAVDFDAKWYNAQISKQTTAIFLNSIAAVVISLIVVMLLTRKLRNELNVINANLSAVSHDIDKLALEVDPDAAVTATDELTGDDVSAISERIGQIRDVLEDYSEKLHEQSDAMADALAAAEVASRAKTAFLSSMSHEIRTPMNAIIGLDRLALGEEDLPDSTREYLEKIGASAGHLLDIINEVLDMSRIEAGRMTLNNEDFSFSSLLDQIDIMIGGQCSERGLTWNMQTEGETDPFYIGDDMKLKQVLINLLGNAVKFTPEGGQIDFLIKRLSHFNNQSVFCFTVRDNGIGMSADYLPKIFEPFSQEDGTTKTKYGSTGLGMSITKSIVEMMNGEISVESEKDVGTTFTVTVPLTDSDRMAEEAETDAGAAENAAPVALAGRRVLLAEDIHVNAEIMKMTLQMQQINVELAENGRIAVEKFTESAAGHFDAILMDMRMPEMDGLEASRAIRALDHPDAKTVPIIALTANAFDEDVQRSLQAGLNAHLSKPVDPEALFDTLGRLIAPES